MSNLFRFPKGMLKKYHNGKHFADIEFSDVMVYILSTRTKPELLMEWVIPSFGWTIKPAGLDIQGRPLYRIEGLDSSYPSLGAMTGAEVSEFIMIEKHREK